MYNTGRIVKRPADISMDGRKADTPRRTLRTRRESHPADRLFRFFAKERIKRQPSWKHTDSRISTQDWALNHHVEEDQHPGLFGFSSFNETLARSCQSRAEHGSELLVLSRASANELRRDQLAGLE